MNEIAFVVTLAFYTMMLVGIAGALGYRRAAPWPLRGDNHARSPSNERAQTRGKARSKRKDYVCNSHLATAPVEPHSNTAMRLTRNGSLGLRWRVTVRNALLYLTVGLALTVSTGAMAQDISINLGEDGSLTARSIQLLLLITVLSIAPGIAIVATSFPFLITVLAILRQGIGLQQSPPNMLLVSLALFLTYFVMEPTFTVAWQTGISPLLNETIDLETAVPRTLQPFREFMAARLDADTFFALSALRPDGASFELEPDAPLSVLVPSFLLSEIARAFEIGFLIFLPFLIIDLVVAAVLMSMGMMMVPPVIVSLPFKLAFFVVADGWTLIATSLVRGYF